MNLKRVLSMVLALCMLLLTAGCEGENAASKEDEEKTSITFADVGWDSIRFHNAVAGTIAESVFGYTWSEVPGSSTITHEALMKGEIDVHMETWTDNLPNYNGDLAAGRLTELGVNFDDNHQGFYVPRYLVEGDPERGIEAKAPGLKTVADLKDYAYLFPDFEDPGKGKIYGGIPGWEVTEIMAKKVKYYGLDAYYNYVIPGSDSAMNAALISAYDKGEPIVAYYWEPTWMLGKYDFILLEDAPYDPDLYYEGACACPSVKVTVCVNNSFARTNPEFCAFLSKYHTSSALTSEALAHMQNTGDDYKATAKWFINEHPELINEWLTPEQVQKLGNETKVSGGIFTFPVTFPPNTDAIDEAVRAFAVKFSWLFEDIIKAGLNSFVSGINWILRHTPWFVLVALVFVLGWKARKKVRSGILYAALLCLIGVAGLWDLMIVTLSIVIASVLVALALGLPIGILISGSKRANAVIRPVLDMMQTMPVFVYLIPALLFFGMGYPAAVIATVIYAIVPVIRLTSLGIQQVDAEVVEAAKSFGSTKWQTLFKVQIPQALPTIMTGVNQTLMMSMSMVVTCSMIGARGLGIEVLNAVNRIEIGRGLVAGTAVVILAVLLDRLTQGWFSADGQGKGGK